MQQETITITGAQGHRLAARIDMPEETPCAYAVFAHFFTGSKDALAASRIARGLNEQGIAVLRFDFTGLGESEGEFAHTNFSSNVGDLVAAADHLRREYQAPALLVGHSLGGAAVLAAAGSIPEAKAVVTIGSPADPQHVTHLFQDHLEQINAQGEAEVTLGGRSFRIRKQFIDDLTRQDLGKAIAGLRKALLVLHAPRDTTVGLDNASKIFVTAKHPKSFVSLDDADHLLSRRADAEYAARVIASWVARYVTAPPSAADAPQEGLVTVAEAHIGRFAQSITAGRHHLRADEPAAVGGDDSGPGPYDLLLGALGACTAMTLRMYADHKKLALRHVAVQLKHDRIYAQDCADCETKEGKVDRIERVIDLQGDLDAEQRARLMQIANRCPVHRTLQSEISIETRAAE